MSSIVKATYLGILLFAAICVLSDIPALQDDNQHFLFYTIIHTVYGYIKGRFSFSFLPK